MRRFLVNAGAAAAAVTASLAACAGVALARPAAPTGSGHHHHKTVHHRKAAPPTAHPKLYLYDAFFVSHHTVDVPGRKLHVTGYIRPYVSHQKVTLKAYLGKKLVVTRRLHIRKTRHGDAGRFVGTVVAPHAGILHLKVTHPTSPQLERLRAGRGVEILPDSSRSKLFTELVQRRLLALHFYMPQSGAWDAQTELAIEAYHRLLHRGTSPDLDHATLADLLDGRGKFDVHYPHNGRHAEGNLTEQLLALVDGSKVKRIYPISSGKSTTPTILGNYRVYERVPGYLPDGMYYSDFFIRGYAIHGYDPAPNYPASHGCMRLPISDAISVFDWLAMGDWVDVYGYPNWGV